MPTKGARNEFRNNPKVEPKSLKYRNEKKWTQKDDEGTKEKCSGDGACALQIATQIEGKIDVSHRQMAKHASATIYRIRVKNPK